MVKSLKQAQKNELMITIKRMGINGEGIGYYKKKIMFIPGALTGEVVIAKILEEKPKYIEGELIRVKLASKARVPFPKGVDPRVGGLELAHMNYQAQLDFKTDLFKQAFEKYQPRQYRKYKIKATLPAPQTTGYRAKAQYQVRRHHGHVIAGLYAPHSQEVIDLPTMPTQSPLTQDTIRKIVKILQARDIAIFDERDERFGLKTLMVRESFSTKAIQVTLGLTGKRIHGIKQLAEKISQLPNVVSVFENFNDPKSSLIWGNETHKLFGQDTITEEILGHKFRLSPQAFFQLNPEQTVNLYQQVIKALALTKSETLVDAYCGVGTLGILSAAHAGHVIGMDTVPEAIDDARENAKLNNLENTQYFVGKAEKVLPRLTEDGQKFDALIVDPPRGGLDGRLIKTILAVAPKTFVYVSCNASTLARDLVRLTEKYDVRYIQSIDMFPQTARVEAVVKLIKRK